MCAWAWVFRYEPPEPPPEKEQPLSRKQKARLKKKAKKQAKREREDAAQADAQALGEEAEDVVAEDGVAASPKRKAKAAARKSKGAGSVGGLSRIDSVCSICEEDGHLIHCVGGCFNSFHMQCLGMGTSQHTAAARSPPQANWRCESARSS